MSSWWAPGALLVRPDGYVAWRAPEAVWDDDAALGHFRGASTSILGKVY